MLTNLTAKCTSHRLLCMSVELDEVSIARILDEAAFPGLEKQMSGNWGFDRKGVGIVLLDALRPVIPKRGELPCTVLEVDLQENAFPFKTKNTGNSVKNHVVIALRTTHGRPEFQPINAALTGQHQHPPRALPIPQGLLTTTNTKRGEGKTSMPSSVYEILSDSEDTQGAVEAPKYGSSGGRFDNSSNKTEAFKAKLKDDRRDREFEEAKMAAAAGRHTNNNKRVRGALLSVTVCLLSFMVIELIWTSLLVRYLPAAFFAVVLAVAPRIKFKQPTY